MKDIRKAKDNTLNDFDAICNSLVVYIKKTWNVSAKPKGYDRFVKDYTESWTPLRPRNDSKALTMPQRAHICGDEEIVVFSYGLNHSAFPIEEKKIIAAGFIDLDTLECFGESISLKKSSRGQKDSRLLLTKKERY